MNIQRQSIPIKLKREDIVVDAALVTVDEYKDLLVRNNELEIALFGREIELAEYQHHLLASQQNLARAQARIELYQDKIRLYQRGWNTANSRAEENRQVLTMLSLIVLIQDHRIEDLEEYLARTALFAFSKQQQVQILENVISILKTVHEQEIENWELRTTVEVDVRLALESKFQESQTVLTKQREEISNLKQQLVTVLQDLDQEKLGLSNNRELLKKAESGLTDLQVTISALQKEKEINVFYLFLKTCLPSMKQMFFFLLLILLWKIVN